MGLGLVRGGDAPALMTGPAGGLLPDFFTVKIPCNVYRVAAFIMMMAAEAQKRTLMSCVDPTDRDTDEDILIREACTDAAAFARLYRMHYDTVFRYCVRRLFNRHTAEDVTSTVFFRAMRRIGSFKGSASGFRNWLYRIATNAVNDHLRTAKRRAEAIRTLAREGAHGRVGCAGADCEFQETTLLVKQALLRLKPTYQAVITLRFFEKMKLVEIAEILGQNPATIRSQLSRALNRLRRELDAAMPNREVSR